MGWWTRGATIGRGSSATVSLATAASGELFAVKSNELSSSSLLQKEQSLISQLRSPYIVEYIGSDITCESGGPVYNLLMEYMPGGTLSDLIKKQGGSLHESMIQLYAHQILQGLEYLHSNGIAHCDIKGQNILIGEDGAKIADLGCARIVEDRNSVKPTISGTPIFMAPEVARGEDQGFPADIWALGCTIIEMATGASPWPELNDPVSALYKIGYSGDVPELPRWLSSNAKEFLNKCLRRDVKERWTAKQLLQHPFLHGMGSNSVEDAKPVRNSPTSILDQGFWNSMEVSEFSQESSHIVSSFSSLTDRIKHLIADDVSNLPNWTEDEDWVTVRGIAIVQEENPRVLEKNHNVEDRGRGVSMSVEFPVACLEELGSSITIENLELNSFIDDAIDNLENPFISIEHIMYSKMVQDTSIIKILDSEIKIIEVLHVMALKFLSFPFFFSLILQELDPKPPFYRLD